jgi:XisI protein
MERLNYRELIQKILKEHQSYRAVNDPSEAQVICDTENDHYLLVYVGWQDETPLYGCPIHVDIKDGKFWIHQDFTEDGVAAELLQMGVPKTDIVLAFRSPFMRKFTGFSEG